jgi:hypothetical protein
MSAEDKTVIAARENMKKWSQLVAQAWADDKVKTAICSRARSGTPRAWN